MAYSRFGQVVVPYAGQLSLAYPAAYVVQCRSLALQTVQIEEWNCSLCPSLPLIPPFIRFTTLLCLEVVSLGPPQA